MQTKHVLRLLGPCVLVACSLAACGSSGGGHAAAAGTGREHAPVTLALMANDIPVANLLTPISEGARVAARQINSHGGFGGRKLLLVTCNSSLQPSVGVECAHKTLAKHPVAEFGCDAVWGSGGLAVYASAKVPSFNCPNTTQDFTNRYSFGIDPSAPGQQGAVSRWLCTRASVRHVVVFEYDTPQTRTDTPQRVTPILHGCGKTVTYVFYPLTAVDLSPYVAKAMSYRPDFVVSSVSGAQGIELFKLFAQQGLPASKLSAPDTAFDYPNALKSAKGALDGGYSLAQFSSWGDTTDPQVVAYRKAFKGSSVDPRSPNVEWGYQEVMFFYAAAKKIGFAKFDAASLTKFMGTVRNFPDPLSREIVNPGPKGYPQEKQPYAQIVHYDGNGKFSPVNAGDHGWFDGY